MSRWRRPPPCLLLLLWAVATAARAEEPPLPAGPGERAVMDDRRATDERRRLYDPVGVAVGAGTLHASLEQRLGWDDNLFAQDGARQADMVATTVPAAALTWGPRPFALGIEAEGRFSHHLDTPRLDAATGRLALRASAEAWNRSRVEGTLSWARATENPGDPDRPGAASGALRQDRILARGKGVLREGRWLAGFDTSVRRLDYHDGALADGQSLDQDDRDRWEADMLSRTGYQPLGALDLFVESGSYLRRYDRPMALLGQWRDSVGQSLAGGATLRLGRRVVAEAAYGRMGWTWSAPLFAPLDGPLLTASADVAVTPLTTLRGRLWRRVEESQMFGFAGALADGWSLEAEHELLRSLVLRASLDAVARDLLSPAGDRHDTSVAGRLGGEWRLNARWYLGLDATWETRDSTWDDYGYQRATLTARMGARL